ncbi:MAG: hypothetical protein PVJ67_04230 [Candidatus Pacearchaeota archaeon]|jgi:hypothetical protein
MRKITEKAIRKDAEKEMFELKDKKPALPVMVRLADFIRRKLCQSQTRQ